MHARQIDPILVLQQAADENGGGLSVERNADALALEILRRLDRFAVDRDETMAEDAGRKHRQCNHLVAAGGEPAEDLGARHFAGIEIEIFPHAVENLPRLVDGEKVEIDTFGFDFAGIERRHAVIEAAGERDRNFGHEMTPARPIPGLAETCPDSRGMADALGRWLIEGG